MANERTAALKTINPGRTTIAVALTVLVLYVGLLGLSELKLKGTNQAFVDSTGYRSWLLMAAVSATLWAAAFLGGYRRVRKQSIERRDLQRQIATYVGFAVVVGLIVLAVQEGRQRPAVPLAWWHWGSYVFIGAGVVAAGPWVILLWLTHRDLEALGRRLQPAQVAAMWPQLEAALGAVGGILVSATLTTAALRLAATAAVPGSAPGTTFIPEASWPSSDVLLFGAFYTVLSAFAVVPVLINWRATANASLETLDEPSPEAANATGSATENDDANTETVAAEPVDRDEWTRRLHLDEGIVKSPLALLSIFSPLITAALTLFLPELSGK